MKVEPVGPVLDLVSAPVTSSIAASEPLKEKEEKEKELETSKELASLWYASTLESLKTACEPTDPKLTEKALSTIEDNKEEKSYIRRLQDWLWKGLSWGKKSEVDERALVVRNEEEPPVPVSHIPKLDAPRIDGGNRVDEAVLEFTRDMLKRLKEISEFEEEMRQSSSNKLDKLIFVHSVKCGLKQMEIKQNSSWISYEELLNCFNKNKALHKEHYSVLDELQSLNQSNSKMSWVNLAGAGIGLAGILVVSFATGGAAGMLGIALPLASFVGGQTKLLGGVAKHQADVKEGELVPINQEIKNNSSQINEELSLSIENEEGISTLLKAIRDLLVSQSKEERASFRRT